MMLYEKLADIKALTDLENDILQNGRIRKADDIEIPFPHDEDLHRVEKLENLQGKYCYGWYIAMESLEEQLLSIAKFKQYILANG